MHALAADPDDEGLVRMEMPFWLLRLKKGPFSGGDRLLAWTD